AEHERRQVGARDLGIGPGTADHRLLVERRHRRPPKDAVRTIRFERLGPYATIRTMSTEVRLGPVSYLVLGIIAMRGPCTPYDLKRMVQLSVGNFWPFPHTQLYDEPKRLAQAGLLEETREETGRRRRHYAITEAGRRPLGEWLSEPVTTPTEYRDLGLLKLFFAELA